MRAFVAELTRSPRRVARGELPRAVVGRLDAAGETSTVLPVQCARIGAPRWRPRDDRSSRWRSKGIDRLDGDDAKEEAIRTLGSVLAGIPLEADLAAASFERLLAASEALEAPWSAHARLLRRLRLACVLRACHGITAPISSRRRSSRRARPPPRKSASIAGALRSRRSPRCAATRSWRRASRVELARRRRRARGPARAASALHRPDRARVREDRRGRSRRRAARSIGPVGRARAAPRASTSPPSSLPQATATRRRRSSRRRSASSATSPESYESALALRAVLETLLEHDVDLAGVAPRPAPRAACSRRAGAPPFGALTRRSTSSIACTTRASSATRCSARSPASRRRRWAPRSSPPRRRASGSASIASRRRTRARPCSASSPWPSPPAATRAAPSAR